MIPDVWMVDEDDWEGLSLHKRYMAIQFRNSTSALSLLLTRMAVFFGEGRSASSSHTLHQLEIFYNIHSQKSQILRMDPQLHCKTFTLNPGTVVDIGPHRGYRVMMQSGWVFLWNRPFLQLSVFLLQLLSRLYYLQVHKECTVRTAVFQKAHVQLRQC